MSDDLLEDLLNTPKGPSISEVEDKILYPLLGAIDCITDKSIRLFVRAVLLQAPDRFWEDPSSFSGQYHPPDERTLGGNVLHTMRVARIAATLCQAQQYGDDDTNLVLAAALLHDLTKGVERNGVSEYDHMHPYTLDVFVQDVRRAEKRNPVDGASTSLEISSDKLNSILRLVRCHMGIWSPIPETIPVTPLEWILHFSDLIASRLHTIIDGTEIQDWRWKPPEGE